MIKRQQIIDTMKLDTTRMVWASVCTSRRSVSRSSVLTFRVDYQPGIMIWSFDNNHWFTATGTGSVPVSSPSTSLRLTQWGFMHISLRIPSKIVVADIWYHLDYYQCFKFEILWYHLQVYNWYTRKIPNISHSSWPACLHCRPANPPSLQVPWQPHLRLWLCYGVLWRKSVQVL